MKKYQQKFRKVRDEAKRWDELQSRLLAQFRNASSIIERLPVFLSQTLSHFRMIIRCILFSSSLNFGLFFTSGDSKFQELLYFEMHRWNQRRSVEKADGIVGNNFALVEKDSVRIVFCYYLVLILCLVAEKTKESREIVIRIVYVWFP